MYPVLDMDIKFLWDKKATQWERNSTSKINSLYSNMKTRLRWRNTPTADLCHTCSPTLVLFFPEELARLCRQHKQTQQKPTAAPFPQPEEHCHVLLSTEARPGHSRIQPHLLFCNQSDHPSSPCFDDWTSLVHTTVMFVRSYGRIINPIFAQECQGALSDF